MKCLSRLAFTLGLFIASTVFGAEQPAATRALQLPAPASFQIRNKQFRDLLRPKDANNATGTPLVLYPAEPWKCMTWKITRAGETTFRLQNHFTSKTFGTRTHPNGEEDNAVIQLPLGKENGGTAWAIIRLDDGTFKFTEPKTGKVLTAKQEGHGSGVHIVLEPFTGEDTQKWELKEIDPATLTM